MTIVAMATIASAVALASGLTAVGDGKRFQYTPSDIFKGRRDAVLYVWLALSTAFSLARVAILTVHGLKHDWSAHSTEETTILLVQIGTALLITAGHFYIKYELHEPESRVEFLWGKSAS